MLSFHRIAKVLKVLIKTQARWPADHRWSAAVIDPDYTGARWCYLWVASTAGGKNNLPTSLKLRQRRFDAIRNNLSRRRKIVSNDWSNRFSALKAALLRLFKKLIKNHLKDGGKSKHGKPFLLIIVEEASFCLATVRSKWWIRSLGMALALIDANYPRHAGVGCGTFA